MKIDKTWIIIPLLIILVISISGCITDDLFKTGETFDSNVITFQYPDSWQIVNCVSEGSLGAVASKSDSNISVVVQQVPADYGNNPQEACSKNNINLVQSPNYINVQESKTTVNGREVIVHRYLVNEADGSQKEHVATWMKMDDDKLYVLLFSTPVSSYESQRSSYDLIVGTFAIKNGTTKTTSNNGNNANNSGSTSTSSDGSIIGIITDQVNKFFSG